MPTNWQYLTVDQIKAQADRAIAIGPFGSRMKADVYTESGVPVIRGSNISDTREFCGEFVYVSEEFADQLPACNVHAGDLVFPHRGAIGQVAIVPSGGPNRYMLSTSLMKLTCNTQCVEPLFVLYFFRSDAGRHALLKHASTVGTPGIGQPLSSLRSIRLPVPPIAEQRAIAHILGSLDDKIELNRRMSDTLEEMARTLFQSWFVDFEPVRAKANGREPHLPQPIDELFPYTFEDSEIGEIPHGWCNITLGELAKLNPEIWTRSTRPSVIRYVDLSNTKWGRIQSVTSFSTTEAPSRAQRVLRPGDTIVGTVRPGNGSYALVSEEGLTGSTGFAVLRPSRPAYAPFVYLAATSPKSIEGLAHVADGGAYPAVRPEVVASIRITRPSDALLERFSHLAGRLLERLAENERESGTLAALRDTLLPKLISGELLLKDAERLVAAAT